MGTLQPDTGRYVRQPEIVSAWIRHLNRVTGLTLAEIAAKPYFTGVPPGTLSTIAITGKVPKKWKRKLGTYQSRHRASINLDDMQSAADTIKEKLKDEPEKIKELKDKL